MITRFAPSPTGLLHLGHAYAAKIAYDAAHNIKGKFLLRFEDIDHTRVREEYYEAIERDLHWLGFNWDEKPIRQLDRLEHYSEALTTLQELEVVYPCFCTRKQIELEISQITNAPHGPEGSHYPGTCKHLSAEERQQKIDLGGSHCWRLDCAKAYAQTGDLLFTDLQHGVQSVNTCSAGDVILARKDIATSYHLAVVVDDAFQDIDLVTRGEDLLPSTSIHRTLQALLKLKEPKYLHHKLILDKHGKRLAKRDESQTISHFREAGLDKWSLFEKFT